MKEEIYLTILYDYYEKLLSDEERDYFSLYHFSNLSLSEIADNKNISRTAVHKRIKKVENILYEYENKIGLYDKEQKVLNIINDKSLKEEVKNIFNS